MFSAMRKHIEKDYMPVTDSEFDSAILAADFVVKTSRIPRNKTTTLVDYMNLVVTYIDDTRRC